MTLVYMSDDISGTIINMHADGTNVTPYASGISFPHNILFDAARELFASSYYGFSSILQVSKYGAVAFRNDNSFGGWQIARDPYGNFYEADRISNVIRIIDISNNSVTIAGSGLAADVDGVGAAASFNSPQGITIDSRGNLYVTTFNYATNAGNSVRKIVVQ